MAVMSPLANELGSRLIQALGLPKNVVWLELRVAVDEVVTVRCEYHPESDDGGNSLVSALENYEVRRRDPIPKTRLDFDAWLSARKQAAHVAMLRCDRQLLEMDARLFGHG